MGKSAKLHKRIPKKLKTGGGSNTTSGPSAQAQASSSSSASRTADAEAAKKRAALKAKPKTKTAAGISSNATGTPGGKGVLGGADYVALMMGGRKKAREEAKKLPPKEDKMQL